MKDPQLCRTFQKSWIRVFWRFNDHYGGTARYDKLEFHDSHLLSVMVFLVLCHLTAFYLIKVTNTVTIAKIMKSLQFFRVPN